MMIGKTVFAVLLTGLSVFVVADDSLPGHAIIRDPQNDYGEDWLAHHYNEYHRTL